MPGHAKVPDTGFLERLAGHAIAEAFVEGNGTDLRVAPGLVETLRQRCFVAGLHQGSSYPRATAVGEHGETADLAVLREIDSCGADRAVVLECQKMLAVSVAIVHLERRRHGLLVDEDRETDPANRREIGVEISASNPNGHQSNRLCTRATAIDIIARMNAPSAASDGHSWLRSAPRSMIPRTSRRKWVSGRISAIHWAGTGMPV